MEKISAGNPVVFIDSYQHSSKYWFYSGKKSFSLNTPFYRRNNYNFWPLEDSLIGKKVLVVGRKDSVLNRSLTDPRFEGAGYQLIDSYYSFSKVKFEGFGRVGKELTFKVQAPTNYVAFFQDPAYQQVPILYALITPNKGIQYLPTGLSLKDIRENGQLLKASNIPPVRKHQVLKISIGTAVELPSLNSSIISPALINWIE
jgi:hypothetical protein